MNRLFEIMATSLAKSAGRPGMFALAALLSLVGFVAFSSNSEHLLGGASLAISALTLLLLPILQASQNRDGAALQAKVDELIKIHSEARNSLIGIEKRSNDEIEQARLNEEKESEARSPRDGQAASD